MGNGESTSRRIAMQRADDGSIQISEDVMFRLKGQEKQISDQHVALGPGESVIREDELKMMIENAFLQGRKHEYEKHKNDYKVNDDLLKQQEQQYKQKIIDLETELHNKLDTTSHKSESEEANQLLAQEREKFDQKMSEMKGAIGKLTEEKGILENKFSLREQEIQQEFDKSVEDVRQKVKPLEESQICTESLTKVLECYKLHKTKSLRCAEEVKAFVDCVQETRLKFMQKHLIDTGKS